MLKKLALILTAAAILPLGIALAHDGEGDDSPKTSRVGQNFETRRETIKSNFEQRRAEFTSKKDELKKKAEDKKDEACQRRISKLDNRIKNSDNRKKGLLTHYQKAAEHIQRLIDRGKAAGVDTSKLEADLVEYNNKVDQLETDYNAFVDTISQAQTIDCTNPKEQLKTLHDAIKAAHQKVISDRKAIHDYYKNTIRPDAVDLIKAINAKKSESTEDKNEGGQQ